MRIITFISREVQKANWTTIQLKAILIFMCHLQCTAIDIFYCGVLLFKFHYANFHLLQNAKINFTYMCKPIPGPSLHWPTTTFCINDVSSLFIFMVTRLHPRDQTVLPNCSSKNAPLMGWVVIAVEIIAFLSRIPELNTTWHFIKRSNWYCAFCYFKLNETLHIYFKILPLLTHLLHFL